MRILILGGDGYLGWPTAMHFAMRGHEVTVFDNYLRRRITLQTDSEPLLPLPSLPERARRFELETGKHINVVIGDCCDHEYLLKAVQEASPEAIVHYAEQPSAPYSMANRNSARLTLENNLGATFNLIWAVLEAAPDCHIIKLGTMGEYGTPNIDIEEGWIDINHKGRSQKFLYPRQAGSLYHTTKVLDTDLLWFYVRIYGLQVTDLMQGPVYGQSTPEMDIHPDLLTAFNYDDIFGTVVNRFVTQAIAGVPLTVYGKGGQTRGYLNIMDTIQCIELAAASPPGRGQLRVLNQFTERFSVNQLAERVKLVGDRMGLSVQIQSVENPRKEAEEHYYNPVHSGLLDLGLKPHFLTDDVMAAMLERIHQHRDAIDIRKILPRVRWSS
ncbi:MAG: NAD-dependent epimerase/dehydratase family protein [Ferrovibrio sp.]|uniref:NAD-dependent epimerase/dehydratase family protein n=1 Tax=Ferrovibrio sp. TaxID=1917215 RepID=UPI003919685C